jgi:pimeloyl-ACP methyl ester carboxylesterase
MKFFLVACVSLTSLVSLSQESFDKPRKPEIAKEDQQSGVIERLQVKRIALKTGVELEYVEQGSKDGIPVVLLHGITDSWHSYETTLPYLPGDFHVFAISQRGHGNSQKKAKGYRPKEFAADVAAFIEQKNLGATIVVGHSMGGVVTQQFVLDYPNLAKAVVIVSSDPAISKNPGIPGFYEEVQKMPDTASREFMQEFQKATLSKSIDSSYFNTLVDESMKMPIPIFKMVLKELMAVDYTEQLKSIKQPVLVFWGAKDAFFLREGQEKLVENIKQAKWIVYQDTGHAPHWEEPQRFAKDLIEFINAVSGK